MRRRWRHQGAKVGLALIWKETETKSRALWLRLDVARSYSLGWAEQYSCSAWRGQILEIMLPPRPPRYDTAAAAARASMFSADFELLKEKTIRRKKKLLRDGPPVLSGQKAACGTCRLARSNRRAPSRPLAWHCAAPPHKLYLTALPHNG